MTAAIDTLWLPPPQVHQIAPIVPASEALAFLAYAACGAPVDSMRSAAERTTRAVRTWVDPAHRQLIERGLMDWPATLAFDQMGVTPEHRADEGANSQMARQWAVQRGDAGPERAYIVAVKAQMRLKMAGDIDPAGALLDARLALAVGDTADATAELDYYALDAIPRLGLRLTEGADESASFVRALALRADLAHRLRDAPTAARWGQAVVALWGGADAELQPVVTRARADLQP